jgi:hypothetical protein
VEIRLSTSVALRDLGPNSLDLRKGCFHLIEICSDPAGLPSSLFRGNISMMGSPSASSFRGRKISPGGKGEQGRTGRAGVE